MLRYIWKERFDDRTFWAGVLSLVAKGLATLHSGGGTALIQATPHTDRPGKLPNEEQVLLMEFTYYRSTKPFPNQRLARVVFYAAGIVLTLGGLWGFWIDWHVGR